MAFIARVTYPAAGVGPKSVPFPYLVQSDTRVFIQGPAEENPTELTLGVDFTWTNASTINYTGTSGKDLTIRRITDVSALLVTLAATSTLVSSQIVIVERQLLYLIQEAQDDGLDVANDLLRVLRVPYGEAVDVLPGALLRASNLLAFDSAGDPIPGPNAGLVASLVAGLTPTGLPNTTAVINFAALAALSAPSPGQQVVVAGRTTAYDDGGGEFVFDPSVSAPTIAANPTKSRLIAPTNPLILGAWRRKDVIQLALKHIGASPSTGGDKSAAINYFLGTEIGTVAALQLTDKQTVALDFGDAHILLDNPIKVQQNYVTLFGNEAVLDCHGVSPHAIVMDGDNSTNNPLFCRLRGLIGYQATGSTFDLTFASYLLADRIKAINGGGAGYRVEGGAGLQFRDCEAHGNAGYGYLEEAGVKTYAGQVGTPPVLQCINNRLDFFHATLNGGGMLISESASFTSSNHDLEVNGGTTGNGVLFRGCYSSRLIDPYHELNRYEYQDVAYPTGPFKLYVASIGGGTVVQGYNRCIRPKFAGELIQPGSIVTTSVSVSGVTNSGLDGPALLGGLTVIDNTATLFKMPPRADIYNAATFTDGGAGTSYGGVRSGSATLTTAATSIAVATPAGAPFASATYTPVVTPITSTGSPAAGSRRTWITGISQTGFTINAEAAPGGGATVTFGWRVGPEA